MRELDTVIIDDKRFFNAIDRGRNVLTQEHLGANEILQMAGRVHGRVAGGRVFILSDRDIFFSALKPTAPEFQLAGDSERVAMTCAALGVRADELDLPVPLAPFDIYLMHIPGKELDTASKAAEICTSLENAGLSVLFDDRDDRAGVKFNDADLIGCPVRITVGEKALKNGMVELKPRKEKENRVIPIEAISEIIPSLLKALAAANLQ